MIDQPAATEPDTAADPRARRADHHRFILNDLIERGADLARLVHENAKAKVEAAAPGTAPGIAGADIAFERLARGVRRGILLMQRLDAPLPTPVSHPAHHSIAARQRIIRVVEDAIRGSADGSDIEDALHAELLDRLDRPELADDIDYRPVDAIILDICHDLGLEEMPGLQVWKRRTPDDVAILCARAAAPRTAAAIIPPATSPPTHPATPIQTAARCRSP